MLRSALLLVGLLNTQVLAIDGNPLPTGQKYEVVFPKQLHAQHKRETRGKYPDLVQYGLKLDGKPLVMHLEKTEDLISENYTETHYLPDDTMIMNSPENQDHCYYQGHVKNDSGSLVSISTCRGLSGLIQTRGRRYLIEPLKLTDRDEHAVYPYESQDGSPRTCGVTNTTWAEGNITKTSRSSSNREKQEFLKSQKFIHLYMVADNSIFKKYNKSDAAVKNRIFEIVNYINMVYKAINTYVALSGMEIWSSKNQFEVVTSAGANLDKFSNWRRDNLLPRKPNDNAQFLTDTDFDGATVGLAFVGTMCSSSHSTGVIQDHSTNSISVGATIAHEMGHNLGMNHDTSSCSCLADSCIMSASLSYNTPLLFSSCSHQNFQDFILNHMPMCMKNKPQIKDIQTPPVCGNKFIELGEQCDCGTVEECTNPCCDAATCKLKPKAKCADGECCENCQIQKAGILCRASKHDCDLADQCDGTSTECPSDRFRVNGFPCRNNQGYCYNGKCPILQSQCSVLWGASSVVADDTCFDINKRGVGYGHCLQSEGTFLPCAAKNVKCGVLFCNGGSDEPRITGTYATFRNCKVVMSLVGMVENGTRCGDNMVCNSGDCMNIESAYRSSDCSTKCKGHAVCDHELQCQCEEGWTPPNCDSTSGTNVIIIVAVALVVVALIFSLVLLVKFRRGSLRWKHRNPAATVAGMTNPTFGVHEQTRRPHNSPASTPELSSRNLLFPPPPPAQGQKAQVSFAVAVGSWPPVRVGYQSPQYIVTSSPDCENKPMAFRRPNTAPPPVPAAKPVQPAPPPQALKPPTKKAGP
ncbi:zinc metalloproteinase-disintegrin-like VMP-III isoform X2 [Ascaphus truei]|uniref:zinc metalloproteinase-disintegrin-like VMP-III isoform X2 n=1 Tax=Ascaphus truei TaxID=8439 RepID=UPI003F59E33A